jgi:hypothetical protein
MPMFSPNTGITNLFTIHFIFIDAKIVVIGLLAVFDCFIEAIKDAIRIIPSHYEIDFHYGIFPEIIIDAPSKVIEGPHKNDMKYSPQGIAGIGKGSLS